MKNLKIFPKIFIQTFSVTGIIIILIHLLIFLIFPRTYLDTRKAEIYNKANEISRNMNGKELNYIEQTLDFYSNTGEIKAFIKDVNDNNEVKIKKQVNINLESNNNSLIIEEREITINNGKKIYLQFVSIADMQKDAKNLSLKFLPYSLLISLLFSSIISLAYAKSIKNNIQEIKNVTDKMMKLDKKARLKLDSNDEVGQLKEQINDLYTTLLRTIDDLKFKNKEILKLEKLKYNFFKGASHELKTPLASLKIILENMKYNIGKYKERDIYINECIDIVDSLTKNISQILSVHSIENLNNDEEYLKINDVLEGVLKKYEVLVNQKNITINNYILDENIYIGKTALNIILSNLISNAVKYTDENGVINIGLDKDWLYIENSYGDNKVSDIDKLFEFKFDLNKENSNGLGLYIVSNLLNNYNKKFKVLQNREYFVFKIKLSF
ncbi:HAMP domain-containing sensor histidine kinase [Clostridium perfringens]|uniref:HAMP domain-containing sensor histidine kinase n=1 Tax=Clostridium perfringens TaxID=1502 RepID=UPI0013E2BF6A|nr:HAMP domain-containing sensor histidine kinase [Clostridium perfringens]MDK0669070.1 HAMP domain-containing sensor histidine kinase [Clostridium perfringens]MDK0675267.1 HAMP domain-containing sensor histidine kinase [Clostridium perfringens]MDK0806295.1 HAMP domain-containing sensor histidine kinase [Clostridium perfringens]MDK0832350.1 HAMP domain-containing sensor histidine kinase [Clostridium perfringens]MDM0713491.1 HAMP domain-containing sensor histidine kinase [Clostridium perfringen